MAEIYGSHFEYANVSSRIYGLIIATVESARNTSISGVFTGQTIFDAKTKRRYLIDDDYRNSPLSFEVDITTEDGRTLNPFERREIERWLFNRHDYRKLYLDIDDDCYGETIEVLRGIQTRLYLNCRFLNVTRLEYNDGVVGYTATIEADDGYWWQDPVTYSYSIYNPTNTSISMIDVPVDTDLDDYTYPIVTITMGSAGGDVTLINNTDQSTRLTTLTGLSVYDTVTLNGEINYLTDEYYEKFTASNFPRVLNGDNSFTVRGNVASVSFTFQNRRYL